MKPPIKSKDEPLISKEREMTPRHFKPAVHDTTPNDREKDKQVGDMSKKVSKVVKGDTYWKADGEKMSKKKGKKNETAENYG